MILPDVNILVNAFRPDAERHGPCHARLEQALNGPSQFGLALNVLSGFLRIVTHPKVFQQPSPMDEAIAFCEVLLDSPNAIVIQPGARHWQIFRTLCKDTNARGNLVPDAWFAALAIEQGCEWLSLDHDFARFPGLNWSEP